MLLFSTVKGGGKSSNQMDFEVFRAEDSVAFSVLVAQPTKVLAEMIAEVLRGNSACATARTTAAPG